MALNANEKKASVYVCTCVYVLPSVYVGEWSLYMRRTKSRIIANFIQGPRKLKKKKKKEPAEIMGVGRLSPHPSSTMWW